MGMFTCDECHHILANTYKKILNAYPDAYLLGVTATPQRMGGVNLCDVFTSMVNGPTVDDLIELGNLTDFKYFAPVSDLDLKNVKVKFGEYVNSDLAKVMEDNRIIGSIVDNYKKLASGKSAICYCVNVKHSKMVAESFRAAGITVAHVDGETKSTERETAVEAFRRGEIKVLCNAELFSEGFDVPKCQAVILARPTKSLTLFIQQALRPLRPDADDPNKIAIIIDHVQNYTRHGLPNKVHDWTLDPNKPKMHLPPPMKECPECRLVVPFGVHVCQQCSYEFVTEEDKEAKLAEYSGVLKEIKKKTSANSKKERIVHKPTSPEAFLEIAKARDYKIGWVAIQSLRFAKSYEDCVHIGKVFGYHRGWARYQWEDIKNKSSRNSQGGKNFGRQRNYNNRSGRN